MKVVDVRTDDFVRTKMSWVLRRARFSFDVRRIVVESTVFGRDR